MACRAAREDPGDGSGGVGQTRIERSCRIELGAEPRPAGHAGALVIVADGVTVELTGELRGAPVGAAPDSLDGVGIRVTARNVTLRGARVSGYRVGIHALGADGLVLEDCDVSGNFRQRLASTREKEASGDWLEPHANDEHEWFERYGAGIYVERSSDVVVRRCRARAGQNGLVLDRVERAQVYDNDFSFLSGWGIALWRSSDNVIARNACDFCIRGYSHGVYNRGQDSAGILLFEQCSRNVIAENSATHCGDGFFGFAGQEALGAAGAPEVEPSGYAAYEGRGCNRNEIRGNDFSYAAAHGLELTFSFGNRILQNRLVGNAICGIWAGYSRDTSIRLNEIAENGSAGYGLERGGINIEHGQRNEIKGNEFHANACGVALWWDEDAGLAKLPWVRANGHESRDERVVWNAFFRDGLGVQLRGATHASLGENRFGEVGTELDAAPEAQVLRLDGQEENHHGDPGGLDPLPGTTVPVGARAHLRGREFIRLDEWGPLEPTLEAR